MHSSNQARAFDPWFSAHHASGLEADNQHNEAFASGGDLQSKKAARPQGVRVRKGNAAGASASSATHSGEGDMSATTHAPSLSGMTAHASQGAAGLTKLPSTASPPQMFVPGLGQGMPFPHPVFMPPFHGSPSMMAPGMWCMPPPGFFPFMPTPPAMMGMQPMANACTTGIIPLPMGMSMNYSHMSNMPMPVGMGPIPYGMFGHPAAMHGQAAAGKKAVAKRNNGNSDGSPSTLREYDHIDPGSAAVASQVVGNNGTAQEKPKPRTSPGDSNGSGPTGGTSDSLAQMLQSPPAVSADWLKVTSSNTAGTRSHASPADVGLIGAVRVMPPPGTVGSKASLVSGSSYQPMPHAGTANGSAVLDASAPEAVLPLQATHSSYSTGRQSRFATGALAAAPDAGDVHDAGASASLRQMHGAQRALHMQLMQAQAWPAADNEPVGTPLQEVALQEVPLPDDDEDNADGYPEAAEAMLGDGGAAHTDSVTQPGRMDVGAVVGTDGGIECIVHGVADDAQAVMAAEAHKVSTLQKSLLQHSSTPAATLATAAAAGQPGAVPAAGPSPPFNGSGAAQALCSMASNCQGPLPALVQRPASVDIALALLDINQSRCFEDGRMQKPLRALHRSASMPLPMLASKIPSSSDPTPGFVFQAVNIAAMPPPLAVPASHSRMKRTSAKPDRLTSMAPLPHPSDATAQHTTVHHSTAAASLEGVSPAYNTRGVSAAIQQQAWRVLTSHSHTSDSAGQTSQLGWSRQMLPSPRATSAAKPSPVFDSTPAGCDACGEPPVSCAGAATQLLATSAVSPLQGEKVPIGSAASTPAVPAPAATPAGAPPAHTQCSPTDAPSHTSGEHAAASCHAHGSQDPTNFVTPATSPAAAAHELAEKLSTAAAARQAVHLRLRQLLHSVPHTAAPAHLAKGQATPPAAAGATASATAVGAQLPQAAPRAGSTAATVGPFTLSNDGAADAPVDLLLSTETLHDLEADEEPQLQPSAALSTQGRLPAEQQVSPNNVAMVVPMGLLGNAQAAGSSPVALALVVPAVSAAAAVVDMARSVQALQAAAAAAAAMEAAVLQEGEVHMTEATRRLAKQAVCSRAAAKAAAPEPVTWPVVQRRKAAAKAEAAIMLQAGGGKAARDKQQVTEAAGRPAKDLPVAATACVLEGGCSMDMQPGTDAAAGGIHAKVEGNSMVVSVATAQCQSSMAGVDAQLMHDYGEDSDEGLPLSVLAFKRKASEQGPRSAAELTKDTPAAADVPPAKCPRLQDDGPTPAALIVAPSVAAAAEDQSTEQSCGVSPLAPGRGKGLTRANMGLRERASDSKHADGSEGGSAIIAAPACEPGSSAPGSDSGGLQRISDGPAEVKAGPSSSSNKGAAGTSSRAAAQQGSVCVTAAAKAGTSASVAAGAPGVRAGGVKKQQASSSGQAGKAVKPSSASSKQTSRTAAGPRPGAKAAKPNSARPNRSAAAAVATPPTRSAAASGAAASGSGPAAQAPRAAPAQRQVPAAVPAQAGPSPSSAGAKKKKKKKASSSSDPVVGIKKGPKYRPPEKMKNVMLVAPLIMAKIRASEDGVKWYEKTFRAEYGNTPDTSKALRWLWETGLLSRVGRGFRMDPYAYVITPEGRSGEGVTPAPAPPPAAPARGPAGAATKGAAGMEAAPGTAGGGTIDDAVLAAGAVAAIAST